jgi:CheY-like chemotaxis protein/nitrogen-specific signal transduction histidine kinase
MSLRAAYQRLRLLRQKLRQVSVHRQSAHNTLSQQQLNALQSEFITNITHEFRTPLTLILAPAEELLRAEINPKRQTNLQTIRRNAHYLLRLINHLLDLAQLEAGAHSTQEQPGNLPEFLDALVASFGAEAARKSLRLQFLTDAPQQNYWFDLEKIETIAQNLIANALKYTPSGGIVTVRFGLVLIDETANSTHHALAQLTVSDTGIGIVADKIPHIFNRFFRDTTSGLNTFGTGIGLSLVKGFVDVLGGTITVSSETGRGSTFTVTWPVRLDQETTFDPSPAFRTEPTFVDDLPIETEVINQIDETEEIDTDTPVILIIDDNVSLLNYLASSMPSDYRVLTAPNGQIGWQQVLAELPDIVISDVMMPIVSGVELCQRIRDDERTNHIGILLLTANSSHSGRMAGLQAGADDYIAKPFNVAELLLRVKNLLDRQRQYRAFVYQQFTAKDAPARPATDDTFLLKAIAYIDHHLADPQFGVERLAELMGLSRSQLHRKVTLLTSLSPFDLIRQQRLQQARRLLRIGQPIAQVSQEVGFHTAAYFTKCFRESFDQTPSAFVAALRREMRQSL